jgi:hypothetical protein
MPRKVILPLLFLSAGSSFGAFVLVDNFNNLTPGPLNGQNGWVSGSLWSVVASPTGGDGNAAAGLFSTSTTTGAYKLLSPVIDNANTAATLFFRLRREGAVNTSSGLSDDPTGSLFGSFEAQLNSQSTDVFNVRDGGAFDPLGAGSFANSAWYNVWMVVNNSTDTYQLWLDTGNFGNPSTALTHVPDPNGGAGDFTFGFRNGGPAANPLNAVLFAIGSDANSNGTLYVDDIYVDVAGQNLTNPVPEPTVAALIPAVALVGVVRRRR